jgi:hypothetical protein
MLLSDSSAPSLGSPKLFLATTGYPDIHLAIVGSTDGLIDAPVAVDSHGGVYWERESTDTVELVRTSFDRQEAWPVEGMPFLGLESSNSQLMAAQVQRIGEEADDVEIFEIDTSGTTLRMTPRKLVTGFQSFWVSEDGRATAYVSQIGSGRPIHIDVTGAAEWSATLGDAATMPIALNQRSDLLYFRRVSTSRLSTLAANGSPGPDPIPNRDVLAFDVSVDGVLAYGSANFTGGPGQVCFAQLS